MKNKETPIPPNLRLKDEESEIGNWEIDYDDPENFEEFSLIWFANALSTTLTEIIEELEKRELKRDSEIDDIMESADMNNDDWRVDE